MEKGHHQKIFQAGIRPRKQQGGLCFQFVDRTLCGLLNILKDRLLVKHERETDGIFRTRVSQSCFSVFFIFEGDLVKNSISSPCVCDMMVLRYQSIFSAENILYLSDVEEDILLRRDWGQWAVGTLSDPMAGGGDLRDTNWVVIRMSPAITCLARYRSVASGTLSNLIKTW